MPMTWCSFLIIFAVQLLGELLLDRANVKVMMRYVSDSKNLQMMMMLLKDNSRSIQFEAFHVFKVHLSLSANALSLLLLKLGFHPALTMHLLAPTPQMRGC